MEQVQTQPTQGLTDKGVALWNKQQWHEFMEHAKAVAPRLTGGLIHAVYIIAKR